jgi:dTDP-4-dehydrorhamnose 3,5-epimerase-like enzyme
MARPRIHLVEAAVAAGDLRCRAHDLRRNAGHDHAGRHVLADDTPGADERPLPHFDAREDRRRRSDDGGPPNRRPLRAGVRRRMRVVEQHGTREDPHQLLDRRELRYEDTAVQAGMVADREPALEVGVGADADALADPRPLPDLHVVSALEAVGDLDVRVDHGMAADERAAADRASAYQAEGLDGGAVADDGIRAYDARLVDAGSHRAIIGATAVPGVVVHELTQARDERGALAALELADCPFEPRRIFAVYDVPSASVRGAHAHRGCHQFLVCMAGSLTCLVDDGSSTDEIDLDGPALGIHIPPMIWATQWKYTRDAVLLVLASHPYDARDYIRDYDEFRALVGG